MEDRYLNPRRCLCDGDFAGKMAVNWQGSKGNKLPFSHWMTQGPRVTRSKGTISLGSSLTEDGTLCFSKNLKF